MRILVANRGEIARRIFRTCRAMGIETVAVFSEPDASMPFVGEADIAVPLRGATSAETYLDSEAILEAARRAGATAVHPGYGFLSENPDFAEAVEAAGLTWIGPTSRSIRAMALKIEAKRLAAEAGVPLVPGAELTDDLDAATTLARANEVGYPLLVKASAGGGGKGMRVVASAADLPEAIASARREAASAFGDPTVFLERLVTPARHVEVQVFGDSHGRVVHLFERECSIQRRHQKIVEESPASALPVAVAERMYVAAAALARAIGYVGAGTVEFLVSGEDFYFLEMNTRLQVEHPVTEAITGIDLVEWQIRVANGEPLPSTQGEITRSGHAIEVRLYAEDPAHGYLPNTGTLHAFEVPARVRVDSGVESRSEVTSHYDPMLAKVIAHAPDRTTAARLLSHALRASRIHGLTTNRESLVAILESAPFIAGDTMIDFLESHPEVLQPAIPAAVVDRHATAAALPSDPRTDPVPTRWRNVSSGPQVVQLAPLLGGEPATPIEVSIDRRRSGVVTSVDGRTTEDDSAVELITPLVVSRYGDVLCVDDGLWSTQWQRIPRFADTNASEAQRGPSTPVPGTVTVVEVAPGDSVVAGQTLVSLEAMKMEHRVTADTDGVVTEVLVQPGQSVDAHTVVAVIDPGEAS